MRTVKNGTAFKKKDDPVVSEIGIFLLPVSPNQDTRTSINRLQFQQAPYRLRSNVKKIGEKSCSIRYKQNVKQLQMAFSREGSAEIDAKVKVSSRFDMETADLYAGEGHSGNQYLNHVVGSFNKDALFLLPLDKTYEMRRIMKGRSQVKSPVSHITDSIDSAITAPIRVRFARVESDVQRLRREQSSLYSQRLIEKDIWLPLDVKSSKLSEIYQKEIEEKDSKSAQSAHSPASNREPSPPILIQ
ncbi:sin-like protein conserved region domain-containing protein [Ditylenchus destructor]|uniref:Sin-like protein conserved region domain-containing protein n=1 Tax=Ditylenchus destructor TaxID=166010 RepID=A0AAD4N762_9BILA|nr:sin-like protein conserved region domain-containing protein [Ditylenchus destructor]